MTLGQWCPNQVFLRSNSSNFESGEGGGEELFFLEKWYPTQAELPNIYLFLPWIFISSFAEFLSIQPPPIWHPIVTIPPPRNFDVCSLYRRGSQHVEAYKFLLSSLLFLGHFLTKHLSIKIFVAKVCNRPIIVFHFKILTVKNFLVFTNTSVFWSL